MLFFKNKKVDNVRTLSIFGLPIYEVEKHKTSKLQKFLGGIIRTEKEFAEDSIKKEFFLFNISIKKYNQKGNIRSITILGKIHKEIDFGENFYNKHKKVFQNRDGIFIMHANLGETFIFYRLIQAFIKKNNIKSPLVVGSKKYHVQLLKMVCPEIPVIITKLNLSMHVKDFLVDNHKFYLMFSKEHFDSVENNIRGNIEQRKHFIEHILGYTNLQKEDFSKESVSISQMEKVSLEKKAKAIGLNLDNFIMLSPEANTCEEIDINIWRDLKSYYESKGYDVFCNLKNKSKKYSDFKQCSLTLAEVYELATRAKEIIGIRSGLLDILVETGTSIKVVYTKAKDRDKYNSLSAEEIIEAFSIKKYPNVVEYNIEKISSEELLNKLKNKPVGGICL